MSQEIITKLDVMSEEIDNRFAQFESNMDEVNSRIEKLRSTEPEALAEGLAGLLRGDVQNLDSGLLNADSAKKLVPADFGVDFETLCNVHRTDSMSSTVGTNTGGLLTTGLSSATEWDPDTVTITLKNHGAYDYFSDSEAKSATINTAREIAQNFWTRYNNTLKDGVIDGDGTYIKGIADYSTTSSWEDNKIQTYTSDTANVDDVWAKIVTALNALAEDGRKFVMLDGGVIAEMQTTVDDNNNYFYQLLKNLDVEVIRNDYLDNSCDTNDATVALVGVKGKAFTLARGTNLVVSREQAADTRRIYTGVNMGLALTPGKFAAQVKTPTASASGA